MMNNNMDSDLNDLFDDPTDLPFPSGPPPKELYQRIDELRDSACHQGIAWSKLGSIASISQSGAGLVFSTIRCHPVDGSWDLSEPTVVPQVNPLQDGIPLQHLCWSPNGSDLAAIDAVGRVSILSVGTFMNKPSLQKSAYADPAEDLQAVVGAYWLNLLPAQNRPIIVTSLAVRNDQEYHYESAQASCFGPCHPDYRKSALICLTTSGDLRLIWPQSDGKWYETRSEIESVVSSNDLITHAAICADKNQTLLVAFATTTKQLRTVRVSIKWGNKPVDKPPSNSAPGIPVNPSIRVGHLAITNWMEAGLPGSESFPLQASMAILSHLLIIPPTPKTSAGPSTLPTVVTVRTHLPVSPSNFNQEIHSTIDMWELRESAQAIHPAFEQLGSRRKSSASPPSNATSLKKLDGITVNGAIILVQAVALDRILFLAYSDGSFDYRDRATLVDTFTEGGPDRFIHLSQIGFSYEDDEPCLQVTLSPTNCSLIQIGCDGKLKWRTLRHPLEELEDPADDEAQYKTVVAGLTLSCSAALSTNSNYDDILAIGHGYSSRQTLPYDLLIDICRNLNFSVDYSDEVFHDTLIRNPSVQYCLTVQNSLGFNGEGRPRSFGGKIAWISLQARNSIVLMTMAANMKVQDPGGPHITIIEDPEAIRLLCGTTQWCLDLIAWLVDSLLHPDNALLFEPLTTGQSIDLDSFLSQLRDCNNVTLHLLLSSAPRAYLTAICRRINTLDYISRKAMSSTAQSQAGSSVPSVSPVTSSTLRAAYTAIATITSHSVIRLRDFETFLVGISTSVKEAYTAAGLASSTPNTHPHQQQPSIKEGMTRNVSEQMILFGGSFPVALAPTLSHIFTTLLPTLSSGIDPAKLFFSDFSLLALDPPTRTSSLKPKAAPANLLGGPDQRERRKITAADLRRIAHTVDIFRRVPIILGQEAVEGPLNENGVREKPRDVKRWRRCARCTAVMEDYVTQRQGVHILVLQERRCFCAGSWNVLTGRQVMI